MKRFYIDGLSSVDRAYFSKDGINFTHGDSLLLYSYSRNEFNADPEEYVIFHSDLKNISDKISDAEDSLTFADSAYHTSITIDGEEYAIDDEKIEKVKDVFCEVYILQNGRRIHSGQAGGFIPGIACRERSIPAQKNKFRQSRGAIP